MQADERFFFTREWLLTNQEFRDMLGEVGEVYWDEAMSGDVIALGLVLLTLANKEYEKSEAAYERRDWKAMHDAFNRGSF